MRPNEHVENTGKLKQTRDKSSHIRWIIISETGIVPRYLGGTNANTTRADSGGDASGLCYGDTSLSNLGQDTNYTEVFPDFTQLFSGEYLESTFPIFHESIIITFGGI
jgi:hypothetical protein